MTTEGLGTLYNLPLEVRQHIYTHALTIPSDITFTTKLGYSLLRTSSTIYSEALPYKFISNPIRISIRPGKWDNLLGRRPFGYDYFIALDTSLISDAIWSNPTSEILQYMRRVRVHITSVNKADSERYVPKYDSLARRREGDEILQVVRNVLRVLNAAWKITELVVEYDRIMERTVTDAVDLFKASKVGGLVKFRDVSTAGTVWFDNREQWVMHFSGRGG